MNKYVLIISLRHGSWTVCGEHRLPPGSIYLHNPVSEKSHQLCLFLTAPWLLPFQPYHVGALLKMSFFYSAALVAKCMQQFHWQIWWSGRSRDTSLIQCQKSILPKGLHKGSAIKYGRVPTFSISCPFGVVDTSPPSQPEAAVLPGVLFKLWLLLFA